jgi:trimeric autotransporter adhesin
MKHFLTLVISIVFLCFPFGNAGLFAREGSVQAKNMMTSSGARNYHVFSAPVKNNSKENTQHNAGYEKHPEFGLLFNGAPCVDCYELIGRRTEASKIFAREGSNGKEIMQQTSSAPMHYKDAQGNWRTIKTQLQPSAHPGVYAAAEQEVPVVIDALAGGSSLGSTGQLFRFNRNLELIYKSSAGNVSLGKANWTRYTAGDDGVYVTDAWPGIDIEIFALRGALKTNFWIQHSMPAYANGTLLVRDHFDLDAGLSIANTGAGTFIGNIEIKDKQGANIYAVSAATAFEKNKANGTLQMLEYNVCGTTVDIALPGNFLNRPASSYPVIIDPLVSTTTYSGMTGSGSSYISCSSFLTGLCPATGGCSYINPATVPAKVTVTDIQFSFQYVSSGGALLNNGAFDFTLAGCKSPIPTGLFWNCNTLLSGTCTSIPGTSIFSALSSCVPAAQCLPYNMNITMNFYQNYMSTPACSNLYISAGTPLTITVFGKTLDAGSVTASPASLCQGQSTTLSGGSLNGVPPYTYLWTPGGYSTSTVNVTPAVTTTYSLTVTDACGNISSASKTVTVNPVPVISGVTSVCKGNSSLLSASITGGTWASSNVAIAGVVPATGIVTGTSPGTATITYTSPAGCAVTTVFTVLPLPSSISGPARLCKGSSITLSDITTGGTWASSNPGVAGIGLSTGVVTGNGAGTAIISYTAPNSCFITSTITVNPIAPISGAATVCPGGNITLSDIAGGGTWASSNTAVATINSSSTLSGVSVGTATITYTTSFGCTATMVISVNALTAISGATSVCQGTTITLMNATAGGTWSSGATGVATVGASSGIVSGASGGTASITYTAPGGCFTTTTVLVNPVAPITGTATVCQGSTTTLSNAISGGTWSSSSSTIASVSLTAGVVYGILPGTATIRYYTTAGCSSSATVSVLAPPAAISGAATVCQGSNTLLSDVSTGGTWSSSSTTIATVGLTSGILSGLSQGTSTITYTIAGNCNTTSTIAVYPLAPIVGSAALCAGNFTALSDATPGGTWSSSSPAIASVDISSGMETGSIAGTAIISYTTPAACVTTFITTVNPVAPITGSTSICNTATLSNVIPGGSWTSSNTAVAAIGMSSGIVTGGIAGTATISYTTSAGCLATTVVTVNPYAPITGPASVCTGSTTTLSNTVNAGTWSSSNTTVATINSSTGALAGVSAGMTTISYLTPAGCVITKPISINPISPISGSTTVCQGTSTILSDAVAFGAWTSSNPSVATINAGTGVVYGVAAGTSGITYTTPFGCSASQIITVNPTAAISGASNICQGSSTLLSDAIPGGTWSSANPAVASVDASGDVAGISAGTSTISYTTVDGCVIAMPVRINPILPVTGSATVCQGSTVTLSDAVTGGTWSSSDPVAAPVGVTSGVVSGIAPASATITYTTPAGCTATTAILVNPLAIITGAAVVCTGNTITLSDATPGGTWSSSNTSIATIDPSTGMLTGVSAGSTGIVYTTGTGCHTSSTITVNTTPPAITGTPSVCVGSNTTLHNAFAGGTWSSYNTGIAMIGMTSGIVTGAASDTTTIVYSTPAGCTATTLVTVNPLPAAITGVTSVCAGASALLADATTGGTWSSSNTSVGSIDAFSGIITGLAAGSAGIRYTTPLGCYVTTVFNVHPVPAPIAGITAVCAGSTTTLSNSLAGGTWSSGNTAIATINIASGSTGGVSSGIAAIVYTTPYGCYAITNVTVNPTPSITTTSSSNPTKCTAADGLISLLGLTPGENYTVRYTSGSTPVSTSITADPAGIVTITGLAAGTYTNISVTTPLGCTSNIITTAITLTLPLPPPVPVAANNSPLCDGSSLQLTATDAAPGVVYSWSGPGGFSTTSQNPVVNPAALSRAGIYSVTATLLECTSLPATTTVVIHPIPNISNIITADPSTCQGSDGTFTIAGLAAGLVYSVNYTYFGLQTTVSITANTSGKVVVSGLSSGAYSAINVSSFGCVSGNAAPVTLNDPSPAPPPVLTSNSPICAGKTLNIKADDDVNNLEYFWEGPNGFTSNQQDISVPNIPLNDSGDYSLVIRYKNCPSSSSIHITVYPPVELVNVTTEQVIPIGGSIRLNAAGALFYLWAPSDGSLSNPAIDSPIASPTESTVYTVLGINQWGCRDSAQVSISVDNNIQEFVPTAFTPNGDGKNDVFRILNMKYGKLIDFSVFNRWGQLIYHNSLDAQQGWDGTFRGVPQEMGVYNYSITIEGPDGKPKYFRGDVTLIR